MEKQVYNQVLGDFDSISLRDKENYCRPKLIPMDSDKEKGIFRFDDIEAAYSLVGDYDLTLINYISSNYLEYYYYNCEGIQDYGWGCAWRCIQTTLCTIRNIVLGEENLEEFLPFYQKLINFDVTFENLFCLYGKRVTLDNLFMSCFNMNYIPDYLLNKKYAPFETEFGWGEPFIAKLILHDMIIEGELFLVNNYSQSAYAPIEVFSQTINYSEFKAKLLNHFSKSYKLPIILDDCLVTICIIGACENTKNKDYLNLLIADPHVKPYKNGNTGIYHIILDEKGNFTKNLNPQPNLYGNRLLFENGSYMIYMPNL